MSARGPVATSTRSRSAARTSRHACHADAAGDGADEDARADWSAAAVRQRARLVRHRRGSEKWQGRRERRDARFDARVVPPALYRRSRPRRSLQRLQHLTFDLDLLVGQSNCSSWCLRARDVGTLRRGRLRVPDRSPRAQPRILARGALAMNHCSSPMAASIPSRLCRRIQTHGGRVEFRVAIRAACRVSPGRCGFTAHARAAVRPASSLNQ